MPNSNFFRKIITILVSGKNFWQKDQENWETFQGDTLYLLGFLCKENLLEGKSRSKSIYPSFSIEGILFC